MLTMPRIRVRLTFPPELIQQPIVYHLVKDFDLIPNIRRAEVKADYGWMALELEGDEGALERAVAWLKGRSGEAAAGAKPSRPPDGTYR